jgi:hypothetical protein
MGLFIIAGTIALVGLIFWIIYKVYYEFWAEMVGALCWIAAGAMLFVLLLIMGCNRSNDIVPAMQQDYVILSLALEEADSLSDYSIILPEVEEYNEVIEQHRCNRENIWTNWLFSPKVAALPLIDINQYDTGD